MCHIEIQNLQDCCRTRLEVRILLCNFFLDPSFFYLLYVGMCKCILHKASVLLTVVIICLECLAFIKDE